MLSQFKVIAFDVDAASLISLRHALPNRESTSFRNRVAFRLRSCIINY